jgi:hypothetical protein
VRTNQMLIQAVDANVKIAADVLAGFMADGFSYVAGNLQNRQGALDTDAFKIPDSVYN